MPSQLPDTNHLAADRTRLAHERTLMAWIRTAVSLISFGFTIFKFFQYLREAKPDPAHDHVIGPHLFAILMIAIGLTALTLAWIQTRQELKILRQQAGPTPYSLASVIGAMVAGLGVVALTAVVLRW
jgi:inner membrane protein YidH